MEETMRNNNNSNKNKNNNIHPLLYEVRDLIVDYLDPEEIILFGSHAKDNQSLRSDVDILIVTKQQITQWQREYMQELFYDYPVKIDLLFYTVDEIKEKNKEYSFVYAILKNHISIYQKGSMM
jgi:predicted nucleotidyltransferase